jgi:CBS domain containing-hemolysin-like protein
VDRHSTENELLLDGTTELRVLESHFSRDLAGKPTDSVNLWIISHLERIPSPGEQFILEGLEVRIERASRRRIHEVRVSRQPNPGPSPAPEPE